jgi:hypothetical protein
LSLIDAFGTNPESELLVERPLSRKVAEIEHRRQVREQIRQFHGHILPPKPLNRRGSEPYVVTPLHPELPAPMAAPCPTPSASPGHVIPVDELVLSSLANDASAGDQIVLSATSTSRGSHQPPTSGGHGSSEVLGLGTRWTGFGFQRPTPAPDA